MCCSDFTTFWSALTAISSIQSHYHSVNAPHDPTVEGKCSNLLLDFKISIYGVNTLRILNKIINRSFTVGKGEIFCNQL